MKSVFSRVRIGILLLLTGSVLTANSQKQVTPGGRSQSFNCAAIDVLIVTDLGFYTKQPGPGTSKMLELFGRAQAYFGTAFDVELKMYVRDVVIPTNETPFTPAGEKVFSMNDVNVHMKQWLASHGYDIRKYDLVLGVSQNQYNLEHWGTSFPDDTILSTIIMELRGGDDYAVRLMAHEMGHSFGASHAPAGTGLMSPNIDGGDSWTAKNKEEMNAFLADDRTKSFFGACPTLTFDGIADGLNVTLKWGLNYEKDVTGYVLYEDGVFIDTVKSKGPSVDPLTYSFEYNTQSDGEKVYWLHQVSKWKQVIENKNAVVTIGGDERDIEFDGYPNPFLDSLLLAPLEVGSNVVIYNSLNQKVGEYTASQKSIKLNTSGWTPGLYFVRNGGRVRKVVKR